MHYSIAASATALLGLLAQVSTAASCTSSNAYPIEDLIASGDPNGDSAKAFAEYDIIGTAAANAVKKRADDGGITCSITKTCLSAKKAPLCLDLTSGDFHDGVGTKGNAVTGDYELGDGRKGNLYKGPHPLPKEDEAKVMSPVGDAASPTQTGQAAAKTSGNGVSPRGAGVGGVVLGGLVAVVGLL